MALFMIFLSGMTMGASEGEMGKIVTNLVLTFIVSVVGVIIYQAYQKLSTVYDYTLTHKSDHVAIKADTDRLDEEVKRLNADVHEIKDELKNISEKQDKMLAVIKKSNS